MPEIVALHERAYVSHWSISHFLTGYWWSLAWAYASDDALPWLNLLTLAVAACFFELFENTTQGRRMLFGCMGYDETTLQSDSLQNSVCDVIFALLGWATVRVVVTYTMSTTALIVMLSVSAPLAVAFYLFFRIEQRILQGIGAFGEQAAHPAAVAPLKLPVMLLLLAQH